MSALSEKITKIKNISKISQKYRFESYPVLRFGIEPLDNK
jgi:hypothetical protein